MPETRLPPITDADGARIQAGIAADLDNLETTDEEARSARPFHEAFPEMAAGLRRTDRG